MNPKENRKLFLATRTEIMRSKTLYSCCCLTSISTCASLYSPDRYEPIRELTEVHSDWLSTHQENHELPEGEKEKDVAGKKMVMRADGRFLPFQGILRKGQRHIFWHLIDSHKTFVSNLNQHFKNSAINFSSRYMTALSGNKQTKKKPQDAGNKNPLSRSHYAAQQGCSDFFSTGAT